MSQSLAPQACLPPCVPSPKTARLFLRSTTTRLLHLVPKQSLSVLSKPTPTTHTTPFHYCLPDLHSSICPAYRCTLGPIKILNAQQSGWPGAAGNDSLPNSTSPRTKSPPVLSRIRSLVPISRPTRYSFISLWSGTRTLSRSCRYISSSLSLRKGLHAESPYPSVRTGTSGVTICM